MAARTAEGATKARERKRTDAEARRDLHELQVHQIELEMQNQELREARAQRESLLAQYTELYDFAPVGYFSLLPSGKITLVNLMGARLAGIERSRLPGRDFNHLVQVKDRPGFTSFLAETFAANRCLSCELRLRGANDISLPVKIEAENRPGKTTCHLVVRDLTERKRADVAQLEMERLGTVNREASLEIERRRQIETTLRESRETERVLLVEARELQSRLRQLARQLLNAQEQERKQISRDLHDDVMQILAGIKLELSLLKRREGKPPPDWSAKINRARREVSRAIKIVHGFAVALRPAVLDDLGLIPALEAFGENLATRKKLKFKLTASEKVEELSPARRTALFRVAQEALLNIVRHARASAVSICIVDTEAGVRMEIRDDGRAFDVEKKMSDKNPKRLGLVGMRERIEMVDGTMVITSAPGRGTTVCAEMPWVEKSGEAVVAHP